VCECDVSPVVVEGLGDAKVADTATAAFTSRISWILDVIIMLTFSTFLSRAFKGLV
jgi:hypothetical protein